PQERLTAADVRKRFPSFAMTRGAEAVFNPDGGMVDADAAVAAFVAGARASGATIREDVRVTDIAASGAGVRIATFDGPDVFADRVVIAAGAWTNRLMTTAGRDAALPIRVTRQTWFTMQPADGAAVG